MAVARQDTRYCGADRRLLRSSRNRLAKSSAFTPIRSFHGRGVGEALLNACVRQAREWGCDVVWLGVWERNPRAIAFYEKWGFRRVGEQRFLVGTDSQRDHVMALRLT